MLNLDQSQQGHLSALFAYVSWGIFPVYFKTLSAMNPGDVLAWRIVLSSIVLLAVVLIWLNWKDTLTPFKSYRQFTLLVASTLMLSLNWYVFVYAIQVNQVMQSSLGYFLVPIISVALGVLVFKEKPHTLKLIAVVVAVIGMCATFAVAGVWPWISITLGVTFGIYGMLRKMAAYDSAVGLLLETAVLAPLAVIYILAFAQPLDTFTTQTQYSLYLVGLITVVPLLSMIFAARRVELGTLGLFQYITPCMHLILAVFIFNETLDVARLMALTTTVIAVLFWLAGNLHQRRNRHRYFI